jgi:WD40 repeat protein
MTIWEEKKLLITASEKVIMLWDMISLTNVGYLKGHKDEIKTMNVSPDGNLLFSAGKGSANASALLIWDLRKGATPCDEREKNQDIFSLASTKDYLFYGCRNHNVYPFNTKTFETLAPFEPPHFDAVTSLAILDNTLVSGSRDKNLRCWDYSNLSNRYSDVMQAHSDWINALETDFENKEMYSGGKDGVVKVWRSKNSKLKCMASLSSNSGGINTLCKIDRSFGKMFAQGSSDKSIRMWKFKDKYLNESIVSGSPDID